MRTQADIGVTITVRPASAVAWLPPPGHYGRVPMANRLRDIQPKPPVERPAGYGATWTWGASFRGSIEHYAGAAFNPDFSPLGAWMIGAGGGNSWWGNNITVGDLSTLRYSIVQPPSPWALSDTYEMRGRNLDPEWRDYPDHSPITSHNYTGPQHLPASWGVTGPKGAYVLACHTWNGGKFKAHKCDMATPKWERASDRVFTDLTIGASYPAATRDDARQCFYIVGARQDSNQRHWKLSKDGILTEHPGGIGVTATVSCMGYAPQPHDVIVAVGSHIEKLRDRVTLRIIRPDGWTSNPMKFTGPRPIYAESNGAHPEWYPPGNCFVFWDGAAETLYRLHPPPSGDPLAGTWEFTTEKLARSTTHPPTPIATTYAKNSWNKLRYVPALKALIYQPTVDEMHIIRPA